MKALSCVGVLLLLPVLSLAGEALIHDSGRQSQGVLSVNQSAGQYNQTANVRVVVEAGSASLSLSQVPVTQQLALSYGSAPAAPQAVRISGNSFAGSQGLLGVNQVAGWANQGNNVAQIVHAGTPGAALSRSTQQDLRVVGDEGLLASTAAGAVSPGPSPEALYSTQIADTAFERAGGVIQINQIAGVANQLGNGFSLRVVSQ